MSNESVQQPQGRNDNNQRQIGVGRGNQMIRLANNPPPPSPPLARRILMIQDRNDIVTVLSNYSSNYGQAIYILRGTGHVGEADLTRLPSLHQFTPLVYNEIGYLGGWFQPIMMDTSADPRLVSRPNGILHVSLSEIPVGACIAQSLVAFGCVEVSIVIVCGPGSIIRPDVAGAEPRRVPILSPTPPPQ